MTTVILFVLIALLLVFLTICWRVIRTSDSRLVKFFAQMLFILTAGVVVIEVLYLAAKLIMFIGYDLSAERTFKVFIENPIAEDVELIAGGGEVWKGYSANLIFSAGKETMNRIVEGFQKVSCERPDVVFTFKDFKDKCYQVEGSRCYYQKSKWRNGDLFLCWDGSGDTAYFKGYASSD